MDIIKRSGLLIPKTYYNTEQYVQIKEHLQRRSKQYNTSTYVTNIFYVESEKFLLIPRNFPIHKYFVNTTIDDRSHIGKPINITHNITPRSSSQERAIQYLLNNENGIIQLQPGVGKTVLTIYMIGERKRKSLVLVHRDTLADQWRERFLEFTDLQNDDISRLTSTTFEDDLDKPIITATVQTFLSLLKRKRREFLMSLNDANVGIFIGDEVHTTVGAPTFSECSIHMPSRYTYGLSATPYRYDGNGDIIEYHLGSIYQDEDSEGTMDAKVTVLLLDYQVDTAGKAKYIRWGGEFQRSRYLNQVTKSKTFLRVLKGLLVHLKNDRNIICMTERIKLIDLLYDWMPHNSKSKFCGTAKQDTLKSKITFTTPGKCRDGIDAPWKDCVIMTSPISNVEQLTGRVTRTKKDKKKPSIIDMVDYGCSEIADTFFRRKQFYENKNWKIQYLLCLNNNLRMIDEEMALTIIKGDS